jgi:hypothetical protein
LEQIKPPARRDKGLSLGALGNIVWAMTRRLFCLFLFTARLALGADADWQAPLGRMPLDAGVTELGRTNCVDVMLRAFQSNDVVKALVFMPGATDELNMFHRVHAFLTNDSPTLLDAVIALTNQTYIRVTFLPPLLLLHTDEDPITPLYTINDEARAEKIRARLFLAHALFNDRDWDYMMPLLEKRLKTDVHPWPGHRDSWHFYRHSFAAWNLNGWEALEAVSLAGKEKFTVEKHRVVFEGDVRVRALPKF